MAQKITKTATSVVERAVPHPLEAQLPQQEPSPLTSNLVQRALHDPTQLMPTDVRVLQRTIGNAAVSRLLRDWGRGATQPTSVAPVQRSSQAIIGPEGGQVDGTTAQRIQRDQGDGKPIPEGVRQRVESATGTDLSHARYHDDNNAHALNSALGAKAFTHQDRIFLGKNQSAADVQLMAHELTHVVQQTGSSLQRKSASQGPTSRTTPSIQRKLDWKDTDWSRARFMDVSTGGAGGVLFVGEDSPREIVVKAGDPLSLEAVLASTLINETTQGSDAPAPNNEPQPKRRRLFGKSSKKKNKPVRSDLVMAPGMRIIGQNYEMIEMIAALDALKGQIPQDDPMKVNKAESLLNRLREPGTVVQDLAKGTDFVDLVDEVGEGVRDHTKSKKTLFGKKTKFKQESPYRKLLGNPSMIQSLGRGTAVDIFMGNRDRMLFLFNPENFMMSDDSISFIDNNFAMSDASYFKNSKFMMGRPGREVEVTVTTEESMRGWIGPGSQHSKEARWLIENDFASIAEQAWGNINAYIKPGGDKETRALDRAMKSYKQSFMSNFSKGLVIGKAKLIANLDQITPAKLATLMPGVDEEKLTEIMSTIEARRNLLKGGG